MDPTVALFTLLTAIFLSVWLWAPLFLTLQARQYNRRHPGRATPRVWTMMDYLTFSNTLFVLGLLFLPVAIVLWRLTS